MASAYPNSREVGTHLQLDRPTSYAPRGSGGRYALLLRHSLLSPHLREGPSRFRQSVSPDRTLFAPFAIFALKVLPPCLPPRPLRDLCALCVPPGPEAPAYHPRGCGHGPEHTPRPNPGRAPAGVFACSTASPTRSPASSASSPARARSPSPTSARRWTRSATPCSRPTCST